MGHLGAIGALGGLAYAGLDRVYQDIEAGTGKLEQELRRRQIMTIPPRSKEESTARRIEIAARAKALFPVWRTSAIKAKRARWRRETLRLVEEHGRCAVLVLR